MYGIAVRDELPEDTSIWRYMDLTKFIAMLSTGTLWFAKVAHLEDVYEGYCEVITRETPKDDPGPKWITHTDNSGSEAISVQQMLARVSELSATYFRNAPNHIYVNSWCLANESMAMWEIYGSRGCGVAIRSSIGRYQRAAKFNVPKWQYSFDEVYYHADLEASPALIHDLSSGPVPAPGLGVSERLLPIAFQKRNCFEYEREWRAALYQDHRDCKGCNIEFDLNELINAVYTGPRADPLFIEVVSAVMEKFDLRKPLQLSSLLCPPRRKSVMAR